MQIPVTDAFDDIDPLRSLEVELPSRQIDWLERKADERGLSVDHVLRSVITAQIREASSAPAPSSRSGDGVPQSPSVNPTPEGGRDAAADDAEDSPSSIVDSLRSASERLQDLTDDDSEPETSLDLRDTPSRLQSYVDASSEEAPSNEDTSPGEGAPSTEETADIVVEDHGRSMFDMIEDDE
ncbi:MAG: hypothetical protein V5A48_11240 [Salinivenus sp.]